MQDQYVDNRSQWINDSLLQETIAYFLDPLQETHCLFLGPVTGDSLPVSWIRYRRLVACFFVPLQETSCLFFGSVTGDCCLFLGPLYSDNLS